MRRKNEPMEEYRSRMFRYATNMQKRAAERAKAKPPKARKPIKKSCSTKPTKRKRACKSISSPAWVRAIPATGTHGSGHLQKRLWRLTSDLVRIRDFHKYGYCVATKKKIERWQEGQAGHFIGYTTCRGIFKFNPANVFLQSARSNAWGDFEEWREFEKEIQSRGVDTEALRAQNRDTDLKIPTPLILEKMKEILQEMETLPEKPAYYQRAISLLTT